MTDATGAYSCDEGEPIAFSIGSVELGETACASVVHAAALTASGSPADPAALNIMRFLMMLDQDENPENGIAIAESMRVMANSWSPIEFSTDDFETELAQVVSDIASVEGRIASLPDSATALGFLESSLSCAYSGVYFDWFQGDSGGVPISLSLRIFREDTSNLDVGELLLIREDPILPLYLESTGKVTLGALPSLDQSNFSAEFTTPDMLIGSWQSALTAQATDRSGSFEAFRLGGTRGGYRFVGKVEDETTQDPGPHLLSHFEMTLDGDTLSGEAFDLLLGARFPMTGKRITGSNDFDLEVRQLGVATVTLVLDTAGEPVGLTGGWPGYHGNVIEGAGCRLK